MTITLTEREQQLIVSALNYTATHQRSKAEELDNLADKIELSAIWHNEEMKAAESNFNRKRVKAIVANPHPTNTTKAFFQWLARMG